MNLTKIVEEKIRQLRAALGPIGRIETEAIKDSLTQIATQSREEMNKEIERQFKDDEIRLCDSCMDIVPTEDIICGCCQRCI